MLEQIDGELDVMGARMKRRQERNVRQWNYKGEESLYTLGEEGDLGRAMMLFMGTKREKLRGIVGERR